MGQEGEEGKRPARPGGWRRGAGLKGGRKEKEGVWPKRKVWFPNYNLQNLRLSPRNLKGNSKEI
jgi:hypothetical protein